MPATPFARSTFVDGSGTMPTTLYLQHHVTQPDENGVGGESTDAGDGNRVPFTRNAAVNGAADNVETLETLITISETYRFFSVWDAQSGGNCWWVGAWVNPQSYSPGNVARVAPGDVDLSLI